MRASAWLPGVRDAPNDRIAFERYLIEVGLLHHHASGLYAMLPLLKLMLRNAEAAFARVLENKIHASSLELPAVQSETFLESSGRLAMFPTSVFRLRDNADRKYVLSPTNEEVVAHLFRRYFLPLHSDRLSIYQIDKKFRDEPGGGSISRTREFRMVELYTVHAAGDDMLAWGEHVVDELAQMYTDMGCQLVVREANESVASRHVGHRSMELRARSKVRTGVLDSDGTSLLELAKWSPLDDTYLRKEALQMSCLGAGTMRLLLHLFEVETWDQLAPHPCVRWPRQILPICVAIVLPDHKSSFASVLSDLNSIYASLPPASTMLDDRIRARFSARVQQWRRLGVRHLFVAAARGSISYIDTYEGTVEPMGLAQAVVKAQQVSTTDLGARH